ncbi:MAG: SurA N-terminal domain-containing protein [Candidatus Pacebacteria bacterium]|nr:SurA N-terminal domain-containing protein [Candidatus Paceibacterota bacterium]
MEQNKNINPNTVSFTMHKNIVIILVLVLLLVGLGYIGSERGWFDKKTQTPDTSSALVDDTAVVASVDGDMITVGELNQSIVAVGGDVTSSEIQQQVLSQMIAQSLFRQKALALGISVSEEEMQQAYASLVEQFGSEEMLNQQTASLGFSPDQVSEMLAEQVLVQKYTISLREQFQVTVTDEDVAQAYTSLVAPQENAPTLEESSEEIRQYLAEQEFEIYLLDVVEQLKSEFTVSTYLENPMPAAEVEMAS